MAVLLDYIWQSTFCLLFFFGIYFLFLRNEKAFTFTRVFILVTPVLALVFPLISIPVSFNKPDISLEQSQFFRAFASQETPEEIVATFGLPEVTVQSTKLPFLWEIQDYLILTYCIVIVLLSVRLFWNFIQLRMIFEKGWYETRYDLKHNFFLVPTFGLTPIFSFFNKLFWDNTQDLLPQEKEQIFKHEIEHIRQGHSYDVLYYQILTIVFWFNPAIHLMQSALVDIHEYLADEHVIRKSYNKQNYAKLIVKIAFKGIDLPIGNYFIRSTTLKRILMMKNSKKINWTKLLMVMPMSLVLMALISMKTETGQNLLQQSFNLDEIKMKLIASQDSLEIGIKVKKINSPTHYELINTLEDGKLKAQIGELEYEFSNIKTDEDYIKVRGLIENLRNSSSLSKDHGDLIRNTHNLESQAQPEIGMISWYNKIKEQVTIPNNEDKLGLLGGNLVVEFMVDGDGNLTNSSIVRSLGGGIDQQVLSLLQKPDFAKWKPAVKNGQNVTIVQRVFIPFGEAKNQSDAHRFFKDTRVPQKETDTAWAEDVVFDVVENSPEFKGGMEAWNNYLEENLKFPEAAKLNKIEGVVYLVFEIGKDGKLSNAEILRGIGYGADEEALRLISNSPNWIPGKQRGQAVNVRMRMPIRFKLDKSNISDASNANEIKLQRDAGPKPSEDFKIHLSKNLKFPTEARQAGTNGTVLTAIKLDKDGNVKNFNVVESPSEELKNEVIRVLESNKSKWIVTEEKSEYLVTLPIRFRLAGTEPSRQTYYGMRNEIVVTGYGSQHSEKRQPILDMFPSVKTPPLYIIDGEIISRDKNVNDLISPDKVDSMEVIKGNQAIISYNLQGQDISNGVVVITTKK